MRLTQRIPAARHDEIKRSVFTLTCVILFTSAMLHTAVTWLEAPGLTAARIAGLLAGAVFLFLIFLEQKISNLRITGSLLICCLLAVVLFASCKNGGVAAPTTPFLIGAPIAAGLFIGKRAALLVAGFVAATLVFLLIATIQGFALPSPHSEAELIYMRFSGFLFATIAVTAIAVGHSRITSKTVALLEEEVAAREISDEVIARKTHENDLLFENIPARMWLKDDKNNIIRLNSAAALSMGVTIEEAEGANTADLFPDMADKYLRDDLEVIETGVPRLGIIEKYTPLGREPGWVRTDKAPFTNPETGRRYVIVSSIDVTATKKTEEALKESELRFATAAKGSSVGIWDWNVTRDEAYWTPKQYELLGYDDQAFPVSLESFSDIVHPDDRERVLEAINAHLNERKPYHLEYRLKHKTKGYRWFLCTGQAIWDENGDPLRVIGSIMDIHENKLAERALADSERRFSTAAKGSSVGIWDWNIRTGDEYWTPRQYELLGYEDQEFEARLEKFKELLHPDDLEKTFAAVEGHLNAKAPFKVEYRLKHKSKGYRWFLGTGQAIWNKKGEPLRMIGSIMDINEQKVAEEALAAKAEALQRSNKELEQFARIASHDLKAPLRGIGNVAGWLEEDLKDVLDDQSREYLDLMKGRIERLEKLLDDMLSYARIDTTGSVDEVSVAQIAKDAFELVRQDGFSLVVDEDLPTFETEQAPFELIFRNLIENAIKHHDREDGEVFVQSRDAGDFYEFTVEDDGPGIPDIHKKRIFEMFTKLQSRDEVAGSGMGLAMVRKIVIAHGGEITVVSEAENRRGAAFVFTWPKAIRQQPETGASENIKAAG